MTKLAAAFLTTALLFALFSVPVSSAVSPTLMDESSCSCSAPDGSCSVTLTCQGGCFKGCGPNGGCWAECAGVYSSLAIETNLQISNGTYPQLAAQLARLSGREISFSTTTFDKPTSDVIYDLGFKKVPLWSALEYLSDQGSVRINGKDFESLQRLRKAILSEERLNFGVRNTILNTFVADMSGISGIPLRISGGNPMAIANVEAPNSTFGEFIDRVENQTGTRIVDATPSKSP